MSAQENLAVSNLLAQQELFKQLEAARAASGRSIEQVANILGIERSMAAAALAGEQDLTLTELRLLAYAVDAVLEYEVESVKEPS